MFFCVQLVNKVVCGRDLYCQLVMLLVVGAVSVDGIFAHLYRFIALLCAAHPQLKCR